MMAKKWTLGAVVALLTLVFVIQMSTAHLDIIEDVGPTEPKETEIEITEVPATKIIPPKNIEGIRERVQQDELPELLLVSKSHPLEVDLTRHIVKNQVPSNKKMSLNKTVHDHLIELFQASEMDGIDDLLLTSAYRDINYQRKLFNNQMNRYKDKTEEQAYALASQAVAPPGTSEHQTGMAVDFLSTTQYSLTSSFEVTPSGKWLMENAHRYGFVLRYPKDKTDVTSIMYEPWHYRFVGKVHAEYMHLHGLTLEEYVNQIKESSEKYIVTENKESYTVCYIENIHDYDFVNSKINENNIASISYVDKDSYIVMVANDKII